MTRDRDREIRLLGLEHGEQRGTTTAVVAPAWGASVIAMSFRAPEWSWPIPVLEAVDVASVAMQPTSYGMPLLAPTPGRVGRNQSGRFSFRGSEYSIEPRRHGFVRGLPWDVVERSTSATLCRVAVRRRPSGSGVPEFPFDFVAEHRLAVAHRELRSTVTLTNTGNAPQPLDVGWHPYLARSGKCRVAIPAAGRWELDGEPEPTPTGRILPVGPEDDFRAGRMLSRAAHWDDVFTDLEPSGGVVTAWTEESERVRSVSGAEREIVIRRSVSSELGRGGDASRPIGSIQLYTPKGRNAISIEPLSAPPNAINLLAAGHERAAVCVVEPGRSASFEITIGISVLS